MQIFFVNLFVLTLIQNEIKTKTLIFKHIKQKHLKTLM